MDLTGPYGEPLSLHSVRQGTRKPRRRPAGGAGDRAVGTLLWLVCGKLFHGLKAAFSQAQKCAEREPARSATRRTPPCNTGRSLEAEPEIWCPVQVLLEFSLETWFVHLQSGDNDIYSAVLPRE